MVESLMDVVCFLVAAWFGWELAGHRQRLRKLEAFMDDTLISRDGILNRLFNLEEVVRDYEPQRQDFVNDLDIIQQQQDAMVQQRKRIGKSLETIAIRMQAIHKGDPLPAPTSPRTQYPYTVKCTHCGCTETVVAKNWELARKKLTEDDEWYLPETKSLTYPIEADCGKCTLPRAGK